MATLQFFGAAQEVTGSCHLVESPAVGRILLDCGMHQGGDAVDRLMSEQFTFNPGEIDAVILSHAHLDHSGLLPKLVHEGFTGPIYCTRASADLLKIMLEDAAGLYARDLERENLRRKRKGDKALKPAYTQGDVKKVLKRCRGSSYLEQVAIGDAGSLRFHDAGHILGSAIVEIVLREKGQDKTLVFSGDLGKRDAVLMKDPAVLTQADVVLMESTYGDRDHRPMDTTLEELDEILTSTWQRGGCVMIPAFAVGRTQELLFHLGRLHHEGKLDNWEVILDSPMAIAVTQVYDRWIHTLDSDDIRCLSKEQRDALESFLPRLRLTSSTDESMAINRIKSGAIIIAGSGMCTGGRIRHHFKQRIWDNRNTIIFVGFQARNTLGRILVDGVRHIKLFREDYLVRAQIATLGGFSAHAGKSELLDWLSNFTGKPRVVLVHGEPEALDSLSQSLWTEQQVDALIPAIGDSMAF